MGVPERNASIRHLNGLRLAASAEFFWSVQSLSALERACEWAREHGQPVTVLGAGSNVVIQRFVPGLVITMAISGIQLVVDDGQWVKVRVSAGENWHALVTWTLEQNLGGLENLALIPGTVGAAPVQNIGAYGVEVGEHIHAVHVYDWQTRSYLVLTRDQCEFSYRHSVFKTARAQTWIIVAVDFALNRDADVVLTYPELNAAVGERNPSRLTVYEQVVALRSKKLPDPLVIPNVGSFFKNPLVDANTAQHLATHWPALPQYPVAVHSLPASSSAERSLPSSTVKLSAAWLIDHLGFRGQVRDGIAVFENHALVIINRGDGDIEALLALTAEICDAVESRFNVRLEWEPRLIGASADDNDGSAS